MYALLIVLFHLGEVKVQAIERLFETSEHCERVSALVYKKLLDTRPSVNSYANVYCLQIPEST